MPRIAHTLAEIMVADWKHRASRDALYEAVEDHLPEIIDSLELPPPLTSYERAIAKSFSEGKGSFRRAPWEHIIRRAENAGYVEELRAIKRRRAAYEGAAASLERNVDIELGAKVSGDSALEEQDSSTLLPDPVRDITLDTQLSKEYTETTIARNAGYTVPQEPLRTAGAMLESNSTLNASVPSPEQRLQEDFQSQVLEHEEGIGNRVELDVLSKTDLRGCWALVRDKKLEGVFRERPERSTLSGQWTRIPKSEVFRSIQYAPLLDRLLTLGLSHNQAESVQDEALLVGAILETVSIERQWDLLNERRQFLIIKKHTSALSKNEEIEYHKLQAVAENRLSRFAQPPIDRLEEIESFIRLAGLDI